MTSTVRWMVGVACLAAASGAAAQGGPRAFVLDGGARTVSAIDLRTGSAGAIAKLDGTPAQLLQTRAGDRLLVLDPGEGRDAGDAGFQAKTRSAVTVLDARTLAVQRRIELGWGLAAAPMLSARGHRLTVVCPGFRGKSAAESLPREIVTVDLATGAVVSRVALPRTATEAFATPDGQTGLVLSAPERPKGAAPLPAELRFVDLTAGTVAATVPLDGDPRGPVLSPDGQHVLLLDRGKPSGSPDKNVNGRLHAVSLSSRAVEAVSDAGSRPRGLVLDEARNQLLLLSDGAPFKGPGNHERPGELRVIRGPKPAAPIPVVGTPERIEASADGRALYVFGLFGLTRLGVPELTPSPLIKAPRMGDAQSAVSPDGRRGWVVIGDSFITHDLERGEKLEDVSTGRASRKLLAGLNAWASTETSKQQAARQAAQRGESHYVYTEYTVKPAQGALAVVPGGGAVYALNSMTDDLTVVDGVTGRVVKKVAAGGFDVQFLPEASAAIVVSDTTVHVVTYTTHEKQAPLATDARAAFQAVERSPDGRLAVVRGTGGVMTVRVDRGAVTGTLVPFTKVADVAVDWGQTR